MLTTQTEAVKLRLPQALIDLIHKLAAEENRTWAGQVRQLLDEALAARTKAEN